MTNLYRAKTRPAGKTVYLGNRSGDPIQTPEEIEELIEEIVIEAETSLSPGYGRIVINVGDGNLLHRYLDPASNHRTDEFGGSLENRARLLLECIRAIRGATESVVPICLHLAEEGVIDKGRGWLADREEAVYFFSLLASNGVDCINFVSDEGLSELARHYGFLKTCAVSGTVSPAAIN